MTLEAFTPILLGENASCYFCSIFTFPKQNLPAEYLPLVIKAQQ
jgi:hypothetical protein